MENTDTERKPQPLVMTPMARAKEKCGKPITMVEIRGEIGATGRMPRGVAPKFSDKILKVRCTGHIITKKKQVHMFR